MTNVWTLGKMPLNQRAKIFTPFAALKGFEALIRQQEEKYEEMPELSDDQYDDLNYAVNVIRAGDSITVKYFRDNHIRTLNGSVDRISKEKRTICVKSNDINFSELIEIGL